MTPGPKSNRRYRAATAALVSGSQHIELGPATSCGEANDLLAAAEAKRSTETGLGSADSLWFVLSWAGAEATDPDHRVATTNIGCVVHPPLLGRSVESTVDLARWLHRSFDGDAAVGPDATERTSAITIRLDAALAVGGFGDAAVRLGIADLITRLRNDGWEVVGAPTDPLAMQGLEPGLDAAGRIRAAADWYHHNSDRTGRRRFARRVERAAAVEMARHRFDRPDGGGGGDHGALARAVRAEAAAGWSRNRPDQDQQDIGNRADWRFLIDRHSADHLWLADGNRSGDRARSAGQHFLEVDGWADAVSTGSPSNPERSDADAPADVIVIGLAEEPDNVLGIAAANATVVLELGRNPIGRYRRISSLRAARFELIGQYLVTPNLADAKRYVSLNRPASIGWLLAPPPPIVGARTGFLGAANRLMRRTIAAAVATVANLRFGPALAGAGTEGLVIARRGITATTTMHDLPEVLMTSGHDEGSRAVLVDLDAEPAGVVTKMSPRPGYNHNVDAEAEVIESARTKIRRSGSARAERLLPESGQTIEVGGLRGSRERYIGRWTATDLCNRVPASRGAVLTDVLGAIDEFSLATVDHTASWSAALFDNYIGDLFDRYDANVGPNRTRDALRLALAERSMELIGRSMPMVQRHYDLGPWNVVFSDNGTDLTIIDWELAPPRSIEDLGLGGADQLYFCKYWLHIALGTRSVDEELAAFTFVPGPEQQSAVDGLRRSLQALGLDHRFVPLLAGHLWLEAALYTSSRRAEHGGDPGSAARYIEILARRRTELLAYWS